MTPELKRAFWRALHRQVELELEGMTKSQLESHSGATHEEAKAEHAKDTRALEQTYLARGLAVRVAELRENLTMLGAYKVSDFDDDDPIGLTALVELEDEDGVMSLVLLAPAGGGMKLAVGDNKARVITAESPLGRSLIGKRVGDDAEFRGPGGLREFAITRVC